MTALPENSLVPHPEFCLDIVFLLLWSVLVIAWVPAHADDATRSQLAGAQEAVRLAVDRYGPNAIETVAPRLALAELHIADGDFPKAEPLLQQALNITVRISGNNHKSLLPILERLAWIDIRNNRFTSGKQFYSDAIEIARRVHGNNSPVMQKLLDNLADARQKERLAGTQTNVRRKQTQSSQGSKDPAHDLVIANQSQLPPTPPAATAKETSKADGKGESAPSAAVAKETSKPESKSEPAVAIASPAKETSQAPSGTPATPPRPEKPEAASAPATNSPFSFAVDTPQPVHWKANPTSVTPATPQGQNSAAPAAVTSPPPPPPAATETRVPAVAKPAESPAERKGWFLSVGCFSEQVNTDERLGAVQKLGLPGYTKPARNGSMTCVYIGPFPKEEEAEEAKKNLNQNGIPDAYIRTYN
ncbi:MAG: SPOR domain-containing protein [Magnetococcales bacterium]|nr:SPOR domain-containing protein [Magnetococcales bacterium]